MGRRAFVPSYYSLQGGSHPYASTTAIYYGDVEEGAEKKRSQDEYEEYAEIAEQFAPAMKAMVAERDPREKKASLEAWREVLVRKKNRAVLPSMKRAYQVGIDQIDAQLAVVSSKAAEQETSAKLYAASRWLLVGGAAASVLLLLGGGALVFKKLEKEKRS